MSWIVLTSGTGHGAEGAKRGGTCRKVYLRFSYAQRPEGFVFHWRPTDYVADERERIGQWDGVLGLVSPSQWALGGIRGVRPVGTCAAAKGGCLKISCILLGPPTPARPGPDESCLVNLPILPKYMQGECPLVRWKLVIVGSSVVLHLSEKRSACDAAHGHGRIERARGLGSYPGQSPESSSSISST